MKEVKGKQIGKEWERRGGMNEIGKENKREMELNRKERRVPPW